jgi:hypothetical protein
VDFVDPRDATKFLAATRNAGLWVDGAEVAVSLATDTQALAPKNSAKGAMSSVAAQALAAAAWGLNQSAGTAQNSQRAATTGTRQQAAAGSAGQAAGSNYVFDSSSGLYYDSTSGYFFDPKTSVYLYYNQEQKNYMVYDEESKGYIIYNPAKPPKPCAPPAGVELQNAQVGDGVKSSKLPGATGKKIENDMEKWAKQQKKAQRQAAKQLKIQQMQQMQQMQQATGVGVPAALAQAAVGEAPHVSAPQQAGPSASELAEALAQERAKATIDAAAANAAAAATASTGLSNSAEEPTAIASGSNSLGPDGPDTAPDLMAMGTNYGTCTQLLFSGKPMIMSGGGKWACVVSRRQFPSEEQLRSHIQMSDLYKDALKAAIAAGKISFRVLDNDHDL